MTLYNWKNELLDNERKCAMEKNNLENNNNYIANNEKEELNQEIIQLKKEIYRLQLEKDILEKAAQIIKKEMGINLEELTNKEKVIIIDALKDRYLLKELLLELKMAKSSYFYHERFLEENDKYNELRTQIKIYFI